MNRSLLSNLLAQVRSGEEIVLARRGKALAVVRLSEGKGCEAGCDCLHSAAMIKVYSPELVDNG